MSANASSSTRQVLPLGSVVGGKYRIDRVLAEGGMGVIYRGWHLVLEQPIAIKVMRPELAEQPEANRRFLNEARAAARLRGSSVARVLDSGAVAVGSTDLLYIVLEYLEGADLRTVLEQEGPLPLARTMDFILQASEALAEAHTAGIVHRDVKPENLFLTRQPDDSEIIKLLDFGISKRIDADPQSEPAESQSLGSPHYMSPEQMSTPASVDARADIWSLGIVAYELLTLRVPFDADTVATVCAQVLGREPDPLSVYCEDLPPEVETAILGCLHKNRDFRHRTVRELAEALAPFGTAKSAESLQRIRRMFDRRASDPALSVDVDLSHLEPAATEPERLPPVVSPANDTDSFDVVVGHVRKANVGRRIAVAAAAAAAALAFALPGGTAVGGTTLDEMRTRTAQALSPIGAHARSGVERLSAHLTRRMEGSSEPAPAPIVAATAPIVAATAPIATSTAIDEDSTPARSEAPLAESSPVEQIRPASTPRLSASPLPSGAAQRRARWTRPGVPSRVRSESVVPAESSTDANETRPAPAPLKLDGLMPPYDNGEKPRGLRSSPRSSDLAVADRYAIDSAAVAVRAPDTL